MKRILIAGSGSGIAKALIRFWQARGVEVLSIGRSACLESSAHLVADLTKAESRQLVTQWLQKQPALPDAVIVCYGLLHTTSHGPEKSLNHFDDAFFLQNIQVNVLAHTHLAQAIDPLLKRNSALRWMSLSAMVGSISDNRLGGWYSYRMSKAALNMFIKTLSIEWQRKAPNTLVVATHPGTTNTELSAPFQRNVSNNKLYSPKETAARLSEVLINLQAHDQGHLLHWDGRQLEY